MSLLIRLLLVALSSFAVFAFQPSTPAIAQEGSTAKPEEPKQEPAQEQKKEEKKEEEKKEKVKIEDRLQLRAGVGFFTMRSNVNGQVNVFFSDTQRLKFDAASGSAFMADASVWIKPRVYATATWMTSSPSGDNVTDTRLFDNPLGTGDLTYAQFHSESDPKYTRWSLGGAWRAFPGPKKSEGARFYIDFFGAYQRVKAEYDFPAGVLAGNPFLFTVLDDPTFLAGSSAPASYEFLFDNFVTGAKVGGKIGDKMTIEGTFAPTFFSHFEGTGDLGPHGLFFTIVPPSNLDLAAADGGLRQQSHRGRGLDLDVNVDYAFNHWFGINGGVDWGFSRSTGGVEKRTYAGATTSCDRGPNSPLGSPGAVCGDLGQAKVVSHNIYVLSRFRLW